MNRFKIYTHPQLGHLSIKDDFHWWAFFFPVIWFAMKGLYLRASIAALITYPTIMLLNTRPDSEGYWGETVKNMRDSGAEGMIMPILLLIELAISIYAGNSYSKLQEVAVSKGYQYLSTEQARTKEEAVAKVMRKEQGSSQPTQTTNKDCPQCAETIKAQAKICRFCGYKFYTEEREVFI